MKKPEGYVSWLAFSCVHAPLHDPEAIDWLIEQIKEIKPDYIVHLGDGFEADSASRWPSEYGFSLADEFRQHDDILRRIRKASNESKKIFIQGNHDYNLVALNRIDSRLRGLCDYRVPQYDEKRRQLNEELLNHWKLAADYHYCRRKGCYRLGEVVFSHGFGCGVKSGEEEACYFGNEYGLLVRGHTHRPTPGVMRAHKTGSVPLRYWYANPGCLRLMEPDYMKRSKSEMWGQGIVTGFCKPIQSPRRERTWEAEVRVFRHFDDRP